MSSVKGEKQRERKDKPTVEEQKSKPSVSLRPSEEPGDNEAPAPLLSVCQPFVNKKLLLCVSQQSELHRETLVQTKIFQA